MEIHELVEQITKEVYAKLEQQGQLGATQSGLTPLKVVRYIDHTLLKPDATITQIDKVCEEAKKYRFASVCVNPSYIEYVVSKLKGSGVMPCVVIGFPLGSSPPHIKAAETSSVIELGAKEVDMVVNIGAIKSEDWEMVKKDIAAVVHAARGRALVKVIIETCLLTDTEKVKVCTVAKEVGADFVKTSTGFSTGGATVEDVALMRRTVGPDMGVKASGGVRNFTDAVNMINAGATRLGTSAGVKIAEGNNGTDHTCINCGNCQNSCPTGNVTISKNDY